MRPTRRYYFEFTKAEQPAIKLYALGETPCKARNEAFVMLERYLQVSPELPPSGWRLGQQTDVGIVG